MNFISTLHDIQIIHNVYEILCNNFSEEDECSLSEQQQKIDITAIKSQIDEIFDKMLSRKYHDVLSVPQYIDKQILLLINLLTMYKQYYKFNNQNIKQFVKEQICLLIEEITLYRECKEQGHLEIVDLQNIKHHIHEIILNTQNTLNQKNFSVIMLFKLYNKLYNLDNTANINEQEILMQSSILLTIIPNPCFDKILDFIINKITYKYALIYYADYKNVEPKDVQDQFSSIINNNFKFDRPYHSDTPDIYIDGSSINIEYKDFFLKKINSKDTIFCSIATIIAKYIYIHKMLFNEFLEQSQIVPNLCDANHGIYMVYHNDNPIDPTDTSLCFFYLSQLDAAEVSPNTTKILQMHFVLFTKNTNEKMLEIAEKFLLEFANKLKEENYTILFDYNRYTLLSSYDTAITHHLKIDQSLSSIPQEENATNHAILSKLHAKTKHSPCIS